MCIHHQGLCRFVFVTVGVGPASIMVGNLVAGKRIAQATGRELGIIDDQDMSRKVCRGFFFFFFSFQPEMLGFGAALFKICDAI